jgi:hypothetical protein
MNALAIADLNLSQDLDREALAASIGAGCYEHIRTDIVVGPWSNYYNGTIVQIGIGKRVERWTRHRTITEYSYWNYWFDCADGHGGGAKW